MDPKIKADMDRASAEIIRLSELAGEVYERYQEPPTPKAYVSTPWKNDFDAWVTVGRAPGRGEKYTLIAKWPGQQDWDNLTGAPFWLKARFLGSIKEFFKEWAWKIDELRFRAQTAADVSRDAMAEALEQLGDRWPAEAGKPPPDPTPGEGKDPSQGPLPGGISLRRREGGLFGIKPPELGEAAPEDPVIWRLNRIIDLIVDQIGVARNAAEEAERATHRPGCKCGRC